MFGPPSQHCLAAKLFPLALSYDWSCYGWRKRNTGAPWRQEADPKLQSKSPKLWATWEQLLYDCKVCIGHAITLNQVWLVCLWFDCWLQCLWQFLSATKGKWTQWSQGPVKGSSGPHLGESWPQITFWLLYDFDALPACSKEISLNSLNSFHEPNESMWISWNEKTMPN